MAPRVTKRNTVAVDTSTPFVDALGLELGSIVRFRRNMDEHWTKGVLRGDSKDGSLSIIDQHGRWRSMMPENVMIKKRGPRGGVLWEPVVR